MQLDRMARAKAKFWTDCFEQAMKLLPRVDISGVTKDSCQQRYSLLSTDEFANYRAEIASTISAMDSAILDPGLQTPSTASSVISGIYGLHKSLHDTSGQMDEDHSPLSRFGQSSRLKTNSDPRSRMLTTELDRELKVRKLSRVGKKEELLRRLSEDDEKSSMEVLQTRLRSRNLSTKGAKSDLINRIVESDVSNCDWGKKVAQVTLDEADPLVMPERLRSDQARKRSHGFEDLPAVRPPKRHNPVGSMPPAGAGPPMLGHYSRPHST
jgi:hypothetical protein